MTAVYPFGRIDFVGHAMIMAALVLIAADPIRKGYAMEAIVPAPAHQKRRLAAVPASLTMALVVVASSYWGLHATLFGAEGDAESGGAKTYHGSGGIIPLRAV